MERVLQNYKDIFSEPEGLLLVRGVDHTIPWESNSSPVNLQRYKYPYFQRKEVEEQVKKMFDASIIQPSHSHFSSLVLLVKKKDGS